MKDQHKKIKGYRELSESEIALMNDIKQKGIELGLLVDKLRELHHSDKRWISIGATDLQKGLMGLTRSVARPGIF